MEFLVEHAPFCDLSPSGREALALDLEISWSAEGERLVERHSRNGMLFIVRKGAVRLELDGRPVAELGVGEMFGLGAVTDKPARFDAVTIAESLLYGIDGRAIRRRMDSEPAFSAFFVEQLSERLKSLAEGDPVALTSGDFATPVAELCARPPVTVELDAGVVEAARRMRDRRVGSVLVTDADGSLAGIVTDRDLRSRVLAAGRGPDTPVREIMSSPVKTVGAQVTGSEAMLELLSRGVHHLPVCRNGELLGMITLADLQRARRHSPQALYKKIELAGGAEDLAGYAADIGTMVAHLYRARLPATDIGRLVAALGDALGSRLLELAEGDLGPPPCPYAWIVFGSEGRREQSLLTDQDNALIYRDDTPSATDYFQALADRVVGDLVAVGIPPCAGGFMATHWSRPLSEWQGMFRGWLDQPEPEALMEAANFFDFRALHGDLDLEPLETIVTGAADCRLFLGQAARACLDFRPPLGLLNRIRRSPDGVDLKAGAIMPIVGLARLLALEAGDRRGSTLQRLARAARGGTLSEEGAELLSAAFRFVFDLRLHHQLRARLAGRETDHRVHLDDLSPVQRAHLKQAFISIHRLQSSVAERFAVHHLG